MTVFKRKLNKFKRDPKLFFKDMVIKRTMLAKQYIPIRYNGNNTFTIVSAVYNVEKYLDDYFKSIVNQSLIFKKHIHIVMVDDGSTDSSAKIIKKWQKKYPKNITYVYKDNGGQASARNAGIEHIKTPWCTFIDPDDFIDRNYFYELDKVISNNNKIDMIGCNLIFYFEDKDIYKDTHPQNYRFTKTLTKFSANDELQHIQLSASLALIKKEIIDEHDISFDERIRPSFEDATFMLNYVLALHQRKNSEIAFAKDVKYYYRKRADGTSSLDTAWTNPSGYKEVLRYGCLATLKKYQDTLGYVPRFAQISVIYYHIWQIHSIVDNNNALSFLTKEQKEEYFSLLKEMFKYIDEDTIDDFGLASAWFYHKAGMLNLYKGISPSPLRQICYIEQYDLNKEEGLFYYFAPKNSVASFKIDGTEVVPTERKIVSHTFLDDVFVYEYRYWIPLNTGSQLSLEIEGYPTKLGFGGQHHQGNVLIEDIKKSYNNSVKYPSQSDIWIVMDRDVQADDNAEHFYRYVQQNHPEIECYFALRKTSHDWDRLQEEGFNLLDFGSFKFERLLKASSKIISSHADDYIVDYFNDKGLTSKDFVFLPHGVFQNDLSSWLNSKNQIMRLFVTTTDDEHASIAGDYNHYKYDNKIVKQTGFPRHDALLRNNKFDNKTIVIMPTWRKYLIGNLDIKTGKWKENHDFMNTLYATTWQSLLLSNDLKELAQRYDYKIIFAPHKNTEVYLPKFEIPDYVEIWKADNGGIQELFQNSDLMITDYSSVAFEMAYLNKMVLYYQFDHDEFFEQQWQQGYFDYAKHGFGPVASTESDLIKSLKLSFENDCRPFEPYATRITNTFSHRDQNNCKRVFETVINLNKPRSKNINTKLLEKLLVESYDNGYYGLAEQRAKVLINVGDKNQVAKAKELLIDALINKKDIEGINKLIAIDGECIESSQTKDRMIVINQLLKEEDIRDKARKQIENYDYKGAINSYTLIAKITPEDAAIIIGCMILSEDYKDYDIIKPILQSFDSVQLAEFISITDSFNQQHKLKIIGIDKKDLLLSIDKVEITAKDNVPIVELLLFRLLDNNNDVVNALKHINKYFDMQEDASLCVYYHALDCAQKAADSQLQDEYKNKVINIKYTDDITEQEAYDYLVFLLKENALSRFEEYFKEAAKKYPSTSFAELGYRYIMTDTSRVFKDKLVIIADISEFLISSDIPNIKALGYYDIGDYQKAYESIQSANVLYSTKNEWCFYAKLACVGEDIDMAKQAYKMLFIVFDDQQASNYLDYFNHNR